MSGFGENADVDCRWYVARTQRAKEALALRNLRQQGFGTFLPTFEKTVRHARKFVKKRSPLFPSYMFVQFDADRTRWRSINGTFGVAHLIMSDDRPSVAPRGLVEDLMAMFSEGAAPPPRLSVGDQVRMIGGPFADKVGRLTEMNDAGRVSVLLEFLGQERPVQTRIDSLHLAG